MYDQEPGDQCFDFLLGLVVEAFPHIWLCWKQWTMDVCAFSVHANSPGTAVVAA
jgi:hypothetical protein